MENRFGLVSKQPFLKWPDDFRLVLRILAVRMGEKPPTAERLVALVGVLSGAIPDHDVILNYDPKGTILKRRALFAIRIEGDRTKGQWNLTPGQLVALVAEAQAEMRQQSRVAEHSSGGQDA